MVALKAKYTAIFSSAMMFLTVVCSFAQQPKARLAGLERNDEYMSLLREDAALSHRIDSLTTAVYKLRELLYTDDSSRKERSAELLGLESDLYTLRDDRSRIVDRINVIEQEWLLTNISLGAQASEPEAEQPQTPVDNGRQSADLIKNSYFSRSLSRNDYSALLKAQNDEKTAVRLLSDYARIHGRLLSARAQYDSVTTEAEADSLLQVLLTGQATCTALSDSLGAIWSNTFDNKSYLYDLLFDMEGREDMLDKSEQNIFTMRQGIARESGLYASDAVVEYCFGKHFIVDYEIEIARAAGLSAAIDSLSKVRSSLDTLRYDFAKIPLRKRIFIDYAPVVFSTRYVYNSKNPVPECPVYEYGIVYRIKLGEFSTQQPVSKFKGLEPVCYQRTPSGGWVYFAGCYRTAEELENALKTVKRLGFTKADIAAWNDGTYAGTRLEVEAMMAQRYAVEISGADELSSSVREIIAESEDNTGLARTGRGLFTVGGFKSRDAAEMLANAVAAADSSLSVSVVEIDSAK